eukprot:2122653-Rhodomonas_salina.1
MSGTRAKEEEEAKARTQEWARRRAEGEAMVREAALKASGVAPSGAPEGTQNALCKDEETAATTHDAGGGEGAAKADPASQPETSEASAPAEEPVKPRRFVGRKRAEQDGKAEGGGSGSLVRTAARSQPRVVHTIPDDILNNEALNEEIAANLPANYNFEVHKTVWRLREAKCKTGAHSISACARSRTLGADMARADTSGAAAAGGAADVRVPAGGHPGAVCGGGGGGAWRCH